MGNIAIQTSQNIAIEQPVASVGERIAAAVIDYAILAGYSFLMIIIGTMMQSPKFMIIMLTPLMFYHLMSELAMNGQSWGKKIMKIRVVKADGTQPRFLTYFIRWVFRLIDVTFLFGSIATITIILNGRGQRLGDIAANTTIIREKKSKMGDTLFVRLPEDYELKFPQADKLGDDDMYTVKEVIRYLKKTGRSMEAMRLADKTKKALENKMGIDASMRSENFLYTILRDYNYIRSR